MYDLVVLGGGGGGLGAAKAAARIGARVALVEKFKLGGECTHVACIPSKALIRAGKVAREARDAAEFGVKLGKPEIDFAAVMGRVRDIVAQAAGSGTGEGLQAQGIDVFAASPRFESYDTVVLNTGERLVARRFIIATGSSPAVPPIPGLAGSGYLDNRSIWEIEDRPESLAFLGAGPVGIELAQAFARLGVPVTVIADVPQILPNEDPEVAALVARSLEADGVRFVLGVEVNEVRRGGDRRVIHYSGPSGSGQVEAAELFVATGRKPNVDGLDLEAAGVHFDPAKGIDVDASLQTRNPRIYAIGDVIGHHLWTHAAGREGQVAFRNAVLRIPTKIDYAAVPWSTYTDPEVATVGLLEAKAREAEPEVWAFRVEYSELIRAKIDGRDEGFAKVLVTPSGRILGATIVGYAASEVLQEIVAAMENGLSMAALAATTHPFPSYTLLVESLADRYRKAREEGSFVRGAVRWLYGYNKGRDEDGASPAESEHAQAHAPAH